jgi:ribosomal protein S18 acetylase RimI-like enzyme
MAPCIHSLVWATDIDVLAPDHTIHRRDGYWVVGSPGNPTYWWGNFLLFDDAPAAGAGPGWERLFAAEFAERPEVTHRTFAWDRVDGEAGAAAQEFVARGYKLEWSCGLIAAAGRLTSHPAANREVEVRALDPDGDEELWEAVVDLHCGNASEEMQGSGYHRAFVRRRQQELREIFRAGRGSWYLALIGGLVAGSLGIVVTAGRARFQSVDTVPAFRRQGVARRLVFDAAQDARRRYEIEQFVIAADPEYHAIGIYEELGFARVEMVGGAMRRPEGL